MLGYAFYFQIMLNIKRYENRSNNQNDDGSVVGSPKIFNYDNCIVHRHDSEDSDDDESESFTLDLQDTEADNPDIMSQEVLENDDSEYGYVPTNHKLAYIMILGLLDHLEEYFRSGKKGDKEEQYTVQTILLVKGSLTRAYKYFGYHQVNNTNSASQAALENDDSECGYVPTNPKDAYIMMLGLLDQLEEYFCGGKKKEKNEQYVLQTILLVQGSLTRACKCFGYRQVNIRKSVSNDKSVSQSVMMNQIAATESIGVAKSRSAKGRKLDNQMVTSTPKSPPKNPNRGEKKKKSLSDDRDSKKSNLSSSKQYSLRCRATEELKNNSVNFKTALHNLRKNLSANPPFPCKSTTSGDSKFRSSFPQTQTENVSLPEMSQNKLKKMNPRLSQSDKAKSQISNSIIPDTRKNSPKSKPQSGKFQNTTKNQNVTKRNQNNARNQAKTYVFYTLNELQSAARDRSNKTGEHFQISLYNIQKELGLNPPIPRIRGDPSFKNSSSQPTQNITHPDMNQRNKSPTSKSQSDNSQTEAKSQPKKIQNKLRKTPQKSKVQTGKARTAIKKQKKSVNKKTLKTAIQLSKSQRSKSQTEINTQNRSEIIPDRSSTSQNQVNDSNDSRKNNSVNSSARRRTLYSPDSWLDYIRNNIHSI